MATKIENKSEFDAYMEAVVPYMTTFMNELKDGNRHVVERTVALMKQRFALDDAQEAALQIVLFNLETMHYGCHDEFPFEAYMGLAINTVVDITLKDWRTICDKRLAEPPAELMDYEDDEEEDPRTILINWYGTMKDMIDDDDDIVTNTDILDFFGFNDDDEYCDDCPSDELMAILNEFYKKMDDAREHGTTQKAIARLLDETAAKIYAQAEKERGEG
jgi:hypothetical protein